MKMTFQEIRIIAITRFGGEGGFYRPEQILPEGRGSSFKKVSIIR
jgi:hypothetical protein